MRSLYPIRGLSALLAVLCLVGCEAARSANPVAPSVAGAIAVVDAPIAPEEAPARDISQIDSSEWTTNEWRGFVMSLAVEKGGPVVSPEGMHAMRADLLAHGADFQNGWRGDLRPRLFLPVPGCPPADRPDVPECSYNRTVDLGHWGQEWQWIKRF